MSEQKNLTEKKEEATAGSSTTNVQPDKSRYPSLALWKMTMSLKYVQKLDVKFE